MPTSPARSLVVAFLSFSILIAAAADVAAQSPPGSAGAKLASKCQQAISKANGKLIGQRLKQLAACSNAVLACVQTAPGDPKCLAKASGKCEKQLGARDAADPVGDKVEAAIVKKCGAVSLTDLLSADVLGFANAAARCSDVGVPVLASVADVAHCLRLVHAHASEASYGVELPRAAELAAQGGVDATRVPDLPVFGGCGECTTGPGPTGKAVAGCAAAINKAAAGFIASTRTALDKCSAAFVKCAQEKPGDAGCLTKAAATCTKVPAGLAKSRAKLQAGIQKKCAGALAFGTLDDPSGINLGALTCACQQVGVEPVLGLDDYATCVARHHECALASLLPTVVPGLDALLAAQGIAVGDLLCEPATASSLQARTTPRAFTPPFGTIAKYMKGVVPAALSQTKSPVATRGTTPRVGAPTSGKCTPAPGKSCTFRLPITKKPFGFKSGAGRGVPEAPKMIVAVRRLDGEFVDDHYELPLADTTNDSEVEIEVQYADDLASCDFELALSVAEDGEVSSYTALEQTPHLPPANDACDQAKAIDANPFFDVVDTTAAGTNGEEPTPTCAGGITRGVWYTYVPDANGILVVTTAGSDFRAAIAVYANGCAGTELACEASPGGDELVPATLQVPVTAGTPYRVHVAAVSGFENPTSTLHLSAAFIPTTIGQGPTISQLILGSPVLNNPSCNFTGTPGSSFPMTVTYSDPAGNVQDGQVAPVVLEHFEPSQREEAGFYFALPVLTGDASNGTASFDICALFTTDTIVSFKVRLVTIGGISNELVGALPKPPGAN